MTDDAGRSIVLTGATGFLGGFLMAGLLERGYYVTVLGRSSKDMSLSDRLSGLVRWFSMTDPGERLCAFETDFSKKHLGLDDAAYARLCATAGKIIHCASDTSFAERNRARVMATNVNSLPALLELAADARAEHLYYVSTAYAAGMREASVWRHRSPLTPSITCTRKARHRPKELSGFLRKQGCTSFHTAVSIVYGHSKTGTALKFNALYYPVKSLLYNRDIL